MTVFLIAVGLWCSGCIVLGSLWAAIGYRTKTRRRR